MSERNWILVDLVKEVLGPRNGPREILPQNQDPRDEFITGVLAPIPPEHQLQKEDIEGDIDDFAQGEGAAGEEDDNSEAPVMVPRVVSPALNPKGQPSSFGLSFSVQSANESPQIEVCVTWARYVPHSQGFERQPRSFLTGQIATNAELRWTLESTLVMRLQSQQQRDGSWRVSIFVVNTASAPADTKPPLVQFVFQPQIRIHCVEGTWVIPVHGSEHASNQSPDEDGREDLSLSMLYEKRRPLGRGHMCSATWREIDIERSCANTVPPQEVPFVWLDSCVVQPSQITKFCPADVRTEFVPAYPIQAPEMDWRETFGPQPELDPEVLAETWDPDQLEDALRPLVGAYINWLQVQRASLPSAILSHQEIAEGNLNECEEVANKINEAIDILVNDDDARLAFCFANKAIATQSRWNVRRRGPLRWRPFQLAFILLNIPPIARRDHADRDVCDLLWFPTGGGKTEAYLGLTAFTLALRRRRSMSGKSSETTGGGTAVISRYTLRLLTIQQFRRALGVITACELLRVEGLGQSQSARVGWSPTTSNVQGTFLWGTLRFSIGLWVGQDVTPNSLSSRGPFPGVNNRYTYIAGALDLLRGAKDVHDAGQNYRGPLRALANTLRVVRDFQGKGEPAQVSNCPRCGAILAVADTGLPAGTHTLHFIIEAQSVLPNPVPLLQSRTSFATIDNADIATDSVLPHQHTLSLRFTLQDPLRAVNLDSWWHDVIAPSIGTGVNLIAARPARPGYFIHCYVNQLRNPEQCDFDVFCPAPDCELNSMQWAEQLPLSRDHSAPRRTSGSAVSAGYPSLPLRSGLNWQEAFPSFQRDATNEGSRISRRMPIPAFTVDDQIYHKCPSVIIGTVDKFARLAFEPKAAALFGNVEFFHSRWGYYRAGCPPTTPGNLPAAFTDHPAPQNLRTAVQPFAPPDLVLQDELHLIEGPLGSMVGLYETAIDALCESTVDGQRPKYVASTATVRQAGAQVQALFSRTLRQFPPFAISAEDRFFANETECHPLECSKSGRLYVGVCAPGKGAQTPVIRIWAALLQSAYERWQINPSPESDAFYTLVGYFNTIRELAKAQSIFGQDIQERMRFLFPQNRRRLDRNLELSSRKDSLELPVLLERLAASAPLAEDAVLATSMFGTGVDVDRLSLMVVHGQPNNTASYIQATGRVGRQVGGLVVTFLRASRPRDLDHYEFFTGYHRALYRHVEPITVAPFSPRTRERALGPIGVALLRQGRSIGGTAVNVEWRVQQRLQGQMIFSQAIRMGANRRAAEVVHLANLLEQRSQMQPAGRRPPPNVTAAEMQASMDRWELIASRYQTNDDFVYNEAATIALPFRAVVLGDPQHRAQNLDQVFENPPQTMREVEETTGFKI